MKVSMRQHMCVTGTHAFMLRSCHHMRNPRFVCTSRHILSRQSTRGRAADGSAASAERSGLACLSRRLVSSAARLAHKPSLRRSVVVGPSTGGTVVMVDASLAARAEAATSGISSTRFMWDSTRRVHAWLVVVVLLGGWCHARGTMNVADVAGGGMGRKEGVRLFGVTKAPAAGGEVSHSDLRR